MTQVKTEYFKVSYKEIAEVIYYKVTVFLVDTLSKHA